jgi:hypothetical protein
MEQSTTKPWILWVGEHAFEEYKQLNVNILNTYEHLILRFTRQDKVKEDCSVYFLDEFTYLPEGSYSKDALTFALISWLKERGLAFQQGLIVGDASEILMQTFVSVSTFTASQETQKEELFSAVYQLDATYSKEWIDLSVFNLLFLNESIPFSDVLQEAEQTRKDALNNYHAVLHVATKPFSINDFLFYYQDSIEEVTKSLAMIQKLN